jgi:excisionase family DNA binding protein
VTTIREISRKEGIPESTIRAFIKAGKLRAFRFGSKKYQLDWADWNEFKEKCRIQMQQDPDVQAVLKSLFTGRKSA